MARYYPTELGNSMRRLVKRNNKLLIGILEREVDGLPIVPDDVAEDLSNVTFDLSRLLEAIDLMDDVIRYTERELREATHG